MQIFRYIYAFEHFNLLIFPASVSQNLNKATMLNVYWEICLFSLWIQTW